MAPELDNGLGETKRGVVHQAADYLGSAVSWCADKLAQKGSQEIDDFPYDPLASVDL